MRCATPAPLSCDDESTAWAIRNLGDNSVLGGAELRFAGDGITGITLDEVEAGWWVTKNRRNQGIATEAMRVAIGDLWGRADVESMTPCSRHCGSAARVSRNRVH